MNLAYQKLLAGTVWRNYQLVITQWPTKPDNFTVKEKGGIYPQDCGQPFPVDGCVNVTLETYLQSPGDAAGAGGNSCVCVTTRPGSRTSVGSCTAGTLTRDPLEGRGMSQESGDWSTFHGDTARSGFVGTSGITAATVGRLKTLHTLQLGGAGPRHPGSGGRFRLRRYGERHAHGANGLAERRHPAQDRPAPGHRRRHLRLADGPCRGRHARLHGHGLHSDRRRREGVLQCVQRAALLPGRRVAHTGVGHRPAASPTLAQNQPVSNIGTNPAMPQAEGWCSPLVVNGRVYVGMGEGENPELYGFVYCLDAETGKVVWILCTAKLNPNPKVDNAPKLLPADAVDVPLPPGFAVTTVDKSTQRGCVVWSGLAYDETLDRVYCATGNPQPDSTLPAPGYAYSVLAIDAPTGRLVNWVQGARREFVPPVGHRRRLRDIADPVHPRGNTVAGHRDQRRLLRDRRSDDGDHPLAAVAAEVQRRLPDPDDRPPRPGHIDEPKPADSQRRVQQDPGRELYTAHIPRPRFTPALGRLYIGVGGNNYHFIAAGIDYETTPFFGPWTGTRWTTPGSWTRATHGSTSEPVPPMYTTPGEGGLSSPAVVNDVVFCSTTKVSLYAFDAKDGTLLWHDDLGMQTGGFSGGYGYCLGPAVSGDFVVAGALINGRDGGVLKIYGLGE